MTSVSSVNLLRQVVAVRRLKDSVKEQIHSELKRLADIPHSEDDV